MTNATLGSRHRGTRRRERSVHAALVALPLVVAVVVGCSNARTSDAAAGNGSVAASSTAAPGTSAGPTTTRTTADPNEDFVAQASDFVNLHDMTPVRGFYVANKLGHLDATLAVANDPAGGVYPVGTIIQLVPQEAMVKRKAGFDPASLDWEFFELSVSAQGTVINKRGGSEIVNRFGGSCAQCHKKAQPQFDFICETTHGCDPLPIPHEAFKGIQEADPRPRAGGGADGTAPGR